MTCYAPDVFHSWRYMFQLSRQSWKAEAVTHMAGFLTTASTTFKQKPHLQTSTSRRAHSSDMWEHWLSKACVRSDLGRADLFKLSAHVQWSVMASLCGLLWLASISAFIAWPFPMPCVVSGPLNASISWWCSLTLPSQSVVQGNTFDSLVVC